MECEACGGKMHSASVVCPHCGARRKAPPKLSLDKDEVRALLVSQGVAGNEEERDWLATLVLPHPSTYGAKRVIELLLTLVSLPFIAAGVLMFALHRLRKRGPVKMRGEVGPLLLMSLMGSLGMWSVLSIAGTSTQGTLEIVFGSIAALIARAVLRSSAR